MSRFSSKIPTVKLGAITCSDLPCENIPENRFIEILKSRQVIQAINQSVAAPSFRRAFNLQLNSQMFGSDLVVPPPDCGPVSFILDRLIHRLTRWNNVVALAPFVRQNFCNRLYIDDLQEALLDSIREELIIIPCDDGLEYLVNFQMRTFPKNKPNKTLIGNLENLCHSNEPIPFSGPIHRNRSARLTTSFCDQLHIIMNTTNSNQRLFVEKRVDQAWRKTVQDPNMVTLRNEFIEQAISNIKRESELLFSNPLEPCEIDFRAIPMLPEYIDHANESREAKLQSIIQISSVFKELNAFIKFVQKRISDNDEIHKVLMYALLILFADNLKLRITGTKSLDHENPDSLSKCLPTPTYNSYRSRAKAIGKKFLMQHRDRFPDLVTIVKTIPRLANLKSRDPN